MHFGTDTHGAQRMNPKDFDNPLSFLVSNYLVKYPDRLAQHFVDIHSPQMMYPSDFGDA